MRIITHPSGSGWLAVTPDIEYLVDATHRLLLEGVEYHPLHFYPVLDDASAWAAIRVERDRLLLASDWTQTQDAPLGTAQRVLWAAYRQALRDIPQRFASPAGPTWPAPPTEVQLQQARLADERPAFVDDTITLED